MTIEKVVCDECGRVKAEANHWHQIGVLFQRDGNWVELGTLVGAPPVAQEPGKYEIHDLCGEQCFHKHIAKLLGFTPPEEVPLFTEGR